MKNLVNRIEKLEDEIVKKENKKHEKFFINEMKKIGIEKLTYSQSSLKRFIDPETMSVHYNKHYKGYVEKLNLALEKEKFGDLDLENIVRSISKFNKIIRNNAGGAYNHALFWKMLSPTVQKPKELVSQRIIKDFGSFPEFKKKFNEVAKERFGSGWVWLVVTKNNTLKVMSTPNQDNPLMNDVENGGYPILGLDLWEHAYYLKYKNRKEDYIKKFWDVVNWSFVEKLYKMKLETKINEGTVITQLMLESDTTIAEAITSSTKCSPEDEKMFRDLLFPSTQNIVKSNLYRKFKFEYVDGWTKFLKGMYPENWRGKDELFIGHLAGLYEPDNKRSLLNNLTSSYTAFCVIHSDVNLYLEKTNQPKIEYGDNPEENLKQLNRFFTTMEGIKNRLFNKETSNTFKSVNKILMRTDCFGKRNEDAAMKIINENLGEGTCEIIAGTGLSTDMQQGFDAKMTINNETKTGQIKPFKSETIENNLIKIGGSSGAKDYKKVDLLIFVDTKQRIVRVFKTNDVLTKGNEFNFPIVNDVMTLQGSKDLEFINCSEYLS